MRCATVLAGRVCAPCVSMHGGSALWLRRHTQYPTANRIVLVWVLIGRLHSVLVVRAMQMMPHRSVAMRMQGMGVRHNPTDTAASPAHAYRHQWIPLLAIVLGAHWVSCRRASLASLGSRRPVTPSPPTPRPGQFPTHLHWAATIPFTCCHLHHALPLPAPPPSYRMAHLLPLPPFHHRAAPRNTMPLPIARPLPFVQPRASLLTVSI